MRASELGGRTRRRHPDAGMRPTVLFTLACLLTALWIAFSVWASGPWRDDLDAALGPGDGVGDPDPAGLHPRPGDRLPGRHADAHARTGRRPRARRPARGHRARGRRSRSHRRLEREEGDRADARGVAATDYAGTARPGAGGQQLDRPDGRAVAAARPPGWGSTTAGCFEPAPGKFHALNTALATVTTPIVVTVDADTFLHPAGARPTWSPGHGRAPGPARLRLRRRADRARTRRTTSSPGCSSGTTGSASTA